MLDSIDQFRNNHKTRFLAEEFDALAQKETELTELVADPSMKELAESERAEITTRKEALRAQMQEIIAKEKEEDEIVKSLVLEVRAGAVGDEAALFARKLADMYKASGLG